MDKFLDLLNLPRSTTPSRTSSPSPTPATDLQHSLPLTYTYLSTLPHSRIRTLSTENSTKAELADSLLTSLESTTETHASSSASFRSQLPTLPALDSGIDGSFKRAKAVAEKMRSIEEMLAGIEEEGEREKVRSVEEREERRVREFTERRRREVEEKKRRWDGALEGFVKERVGVLAGQGGERRREKRTLPVGLEKVRLETEVGGLEEFLRGEEEEVLVTAKRKPEVQEELEDFFGDENSDEVEDAKSVTKPQANEGPEKHLEDDEEETILVKPKREAKPKAKKELEDFLDDEGSEKQDKEEERDTARVTPKPKVKKKRTPTSGSTSSKQPPAPPPARTKPRPGIIADEDFEEDELQALYSSRSSKKS